MITVATKEDMEERLIYPKITTATIIGRLVAHVEYLLQNPNGNARDQIIKDVANVCREFNLPFHNDVNPGDYK